MTDLDLLQQIDELIDNYNKLWAADLKKLYSKNTKIVNTPKWEKKLKKLTNKYSAVFADLLLEREDVLERISAMGEEIFMSNFEPKKIPDEIAQSNDTNDETKFKQDANRVAKIVAKAKQHKQSLEDEQTTTN